MPQLSAAQRIHHNHINSFSFSRYTNNLVDHMILNRFSLYRRLHALAAHAFSEDDNDDSPASTRLPCWLWPAQNFGFLDNHPPCTLTGSFMKLPRLSGHHFILLWILDFPPLDAGFCCSRYWILLLQLGIIAIDNWQFEKISIMAHKQIFKLIKSPPPLKTLCFKLFALKYLHSTMPDIYLP